MNMRKQYHFRQSSRGLLAWDVHRLVDLCRNMQPEEIPLSSIKELDEEFWYGLDGNSPTCRSVALHAKLIMEVNLDHPVILSSEGRVMDGMHRVCRALIKGKGSIMAYRFQVDPEPDFIGISPRDLSYGDQ